MAACAARPKVTAAGKTTTKVPKIKALAKKSSSAEKVAAFRARAKAKGLCSECGQRKPAPERLYCQECLDAAAERVKRSRAY
jgi:hypothetical protein